MQIKLKIKAKVELDATDSLFYIRALIITSRTKDKGEIVANNDPGASKA
jgi:hypothetical protein